MSRLPAHRVCRSSPPGKRSGFALLITITLLAFLVLLLVALSSMTRVETQVSTNAQALTLARQNALMALNIALGQLQLADGPDQRTSAPAVLGQNATAVMAANASTNGLGPVNSPGTAYWTGVWGNLYTPAAIFTGTPQPGAPSSATSEPALPVLLQWLVSGNEQTPAPVAATDGHITSPATAAATQFNPSQSVVSPALSASTTPVTPLQITGLGNQTLPAVLLLGNNSAGANTSAYVVAPSVPISVPSGQIPGLSGSTSVPVGHYAWWVGDEGVKAKYNIPDPYAGNAIATGSTPDTGATTANASVQARYRVEASQRNGIELVNTSYNPLTGASAADANGFNSANYPVASTLSNDPVYAAVGKTLTLSDVLLAPSPVTQAVLQNHQPDLTTYSYGVLADSQFGGLRRDLTFHLDPQSADTFLLGRDILPDGAIPVASTANYPQSNYNAKPSLFSDTVADGGMALTNSGTPLNVSPRLGPKWDQLASFYALASVTYSGGQLPPLDVQPAVDLSAGAANGNQVKVQAAISPVILSTRFLFSYGSNGGVPSIGTSIFIILGNPYTRPLIASKGIDLRLSLHQANYSNTTNPEAAYYSQELGLCSTFVGPSTASPIPRYLTSVFTRFQGLSGSAYSSAGATMISPWQMTYNNGAQYFSDYLPILKFHVPYDPSHALTAGTDYPQDPDAAYPGVLDQVVFQIPPGTLTLQPGQTIAYEIAQNPGTSSESYIVNGTSLPFTVVPMQVLNSTAAPTYWWQPLTNPNIAHYLSINQPGYNTTTVTGTQLFNPATPTDPQTDGSYFINSLSCSNGQTFSSQIDYTLTIPGNSASILQQWNAWDMGATAATNSSISGIPGTQIIAWPFQDPNDITPVVAGGLLHDLDFPTVIMYGPYNLGATFFSKANILTTNATATPASRTPLGSTPFGIYSRVASVDYQIYQGGGVYYSWNRSLANNSNGEQAAWGHYGLDEATLPQYTLLSDVPTVYSTGEIPILSLGQLQHADLTADDETLGVDIQTAHAVGNSWYEPYLTRNLSEGYPANTAQNNTTTAAPGANPNNIRSAYGASTASSPASDLGESPLYPGYVPPLPWKTPIRIFDISYLLNASLWDSTFFSTVQPAAGSSGTLAPLPANQRLVYAGATPKLGQLRGSDASTVVPAPSALLPGENGLVPAAFLLINGAFNVNSTSVEAWSALLAGLRGLGVNGTAASAAQTPFPRSIRQTGTSQVTTPATTASASYNGFRALTDAQITTLAQAIVAQVQARGPFLSLSQFINRNLTPAVAAASPGDPVSNTGITGALQQAIDNAGNAVPNTPGNAGLNKGLGTVATGGSNFAPPAPTAIYPDSVTVPMNSIVGFSPYMGVPGWLTQADLLQTLGPVLSARSDTFVIRTYGDVVNPVTQTVTARAWCEAVVQRLPQYVDPANPPTMNPANPSFTATNQKFGRRFKIVSFRWLSPNDI